jgi:hypothetical protein
MSGEKERMQILEMIERGQISAEDGVRLLSALGAGGEAGSEIPSSALLDQALDSEMEAPPSAAADAMLNREPPITEEVSYAKMALDNDAAGEGENMLDDRAVQGSAVMDENRPAGLPPEARKWKSWWMIPLWIGVAITVSGGYLMYLAIENSGIGFGFFCAGVPFLIGLVLLVLAWQSRVAPWLHLRVQQRPGERPQRIAFSLPIPIRPTVWLLRTFGGNIKELDGVALDEMLLAVGDAASDQNPIYIQVNEGDQGEKVEIYIG